jgi:hypothetical protein
MSPPWSGRTCWRRGRRPVSGELVAAVAEGKGNRQAVARSVRTLSGAAAAPLELVLVDTDRIACYVFESSRPPCSPTVRASCASSTWASAATTRRARPAQVSGEARRRSQRIAEPGARRRRMPKSDPSRREHTAGLPDAAATQCGARQGESDRECPPRLA